MHDDIDTQPGIASWRDVLPIHPAAVLFPRMSEIRELTGQLPAANEQRPPPNDDGFGIPSFLRRRQ